MDFARLKFPLLVAGVGLLLGFTGDMMLYDEPMGVSLPILVLLALAALLVLTRVARIAITPANLLLILPLLFFAAFSAIRAQMFVRSLNVLAVLILSVLLANRLAAAPIVRLSSVGYLAALVEGAILSMLAPLKLLPGAATEARQREGSSTRSVRRVLVGLLIAIPFLCVFTILFASADLIFRRGIDQIFESFSFGDIIGHTFLTGVLAWIGAGWLTYALARLPEGPRYMAQPSSTPSGESEPPAQAEVEEEPPARTSKQSPPVLSLRGMLGALEASVALFSVDALFLVFVAIQFAALFGGEKFITSQGLTYSEYARGGFFELLAVALITLSLLLALDYATRRETPREEFAFLIGGGLMIAMTVIILGSAFYRLRLYELAYGFTRLRVHSHVFMVWLAILLLIVLGLLALKQTRYVATAFFLVSIAFIVTLNLLNPDAFIVQQNLARAARGEGVPLDLEYLGSLSEDAIPQLTALFAEDELTRDKLGPWLRRHLIELDRRQERASWPSWHWSINNAHWLLAAQGTLIERYEPAYRLRDSE